MGKLDGKVALITGAGQGVGQGVAFALAKEGASIAVAGRDDSDPRDEGAESLPQSLWVHRDLLRRQC